MSFYTSNRTGICPGSMSGNPLNGLCERVVIETNKVFDACLRQVQEENLILNLTNISPATVTYPLTFVSGTSDPANPATITGVTVDRLVDKPNYARVSATISIPVVITFTDANGVAGTADSVVVVTEDVILFVPQASIIPYTVEAFGAAVISTATYTSETSFTGTACVTVILKIVAPVDLLIPTYGYATIPPCQEFSTEICPGVFSLPLFPTATV